MTDSESDKCDSNKKEQDRGLAEIRSLFLEVYKATLGTVSKACEQANISRMTFYRWYDEDENFRAAVDELDHSFIDFAESKLRERINDGNMVAIIFFLTNRAPEKWKDRRAMASANAVAVTNQQSNAFEMTDEEIKESKELQEKLLGRLAKYFED